MSNTMLINAILAATALSLACALLSVVVVVRRWAFIGEGISHSGFGGAGTAWLLMLLFPALNHPWLPYAAVIVFCVLTAVAIGALSRRKGVNIDSAIGIFLVATLAWGFLAQQIYMKRTGTEPTLFGDLLFGRIVSTSTEFTQAAVGIGLASLIIIVALWKEILAYAFDPHLAATSGVRAGLIHYLLIVLIALVIVIGSRILGSVLVTALLVLPGATALLISKRLATVLVISSAAALIGTLGGLLTSPSSPGPLIVLFMFVEFLIGLLISRIGGERTV